MDGNTILSARAEAFEALDQRVLTANIWSLSPEQFVEVVMLLWNRMPLEQVAAFCADDLGLDGKKVPSKSALQRFWRDSGFFRLLQAHNRRAARDGASQVVDELRLKASDYEEANIDLINQTAYEMLSGGAGVEEMKPFVNAVVRLNTVKFQREKHRTAMQSKIDAGFEELAAELKGDAESLELLEKIKARIAAKTEEAE